jgi:Protein of unknown function (DUF3592)
MTTTPFPLLPAAISVSGIVILSLASALYLRKKSKYGDWAKTNGRLAGFKEGQGKYGKVFAPIVTFSDSSGQEVTFTSRLASSNKRFEVGDDVPVLYSPLDSSKAMINRTFDLYFLEIILGIAGGWGLIAGPLVGFLLR